MASNAIPYLTHLPWMLLSALGVALTIGLTFVVFRNRRNFEMVEDQGPEMPAEIVADGDLRPSGTPAVKK